MNGLYWDIQLDFEPERPIWVRKHYILWMENSIVECKPMTN